MEQRHIVIAHRGACGYLPEHTTAGKAAAHVMNPDLIEQDVAVSNDGRAIIIHDYLDNVTNVADRFPERRRKDGHFHIHDFTLKELKTLSLHERVNPETGEAVYGGRFPARSPVEFFLHTLEEELDLIQGMNKSRGVNIGICPELKSPAYYREMGVDIARIVLKELSFFGYEDPDSNCLVQCFDPETIRYMRQGLGSRLRMVQLIADNSWRESPGIDYDRMLTGPGLDEIARFADAIGPWSEQIVADRGAGVPPHRTGLVREAHGRGLEVHTFTARIDALPGYAPDAETLFRTLYIEEGADGVFTDFPDVAVRFLERQGLREPRP
ncbi:MAG: glycerophosphodiester phosphodiesterase [Spirochaetes bacterium]|nr:glycerophosphodiester phosphodiesterase [Spirochaetota bacterium]